jgi:hypothetical protein
MLPAVNPASRQDELVATARFIIVNLIGHSFNSSMKLGTAAGETNPQTVAACTSSRAKNVTQINEPYGICVLQRIYRLLHGQRQTAASATRSLETVFISGRTTAGGKTRSCNLSVVCVGRTHLIDAHRADSSRTTRRLDDTR